MRLVIAVIYLGVGGRGERCCDCGFVKSVDESVASLEMYL